MRYSLKRKHSKGSVLVVALLLLVVGTVGMASMASVLSNRSRLVMDMEFGVQRRTAMRNTRVLCQSYFLSDGIGSTSPAVSLDLGGGWGKIAIPATTKSPFVSSQGSTLKNYLGPSREEGFSENVTVTLYQPVPYDTTGAETMTEFLVQLKSRSPLLAGNLLVQHYPLTAAAGHDTYVSGNIEVNGHATLWKDDSLYGNVGGLKVGSYDHPDQIVVNINNMSGNHIPPTNFPFFPRSTGYDSIGGTLSAPVLDGRFNMIQIGTPPTAPPDPDAVYKWNTLHHKMMANSVPVEVDGSFNYQVGAVTGDDYLGQRRITIDLNAAAVSPVVVNDGVFHVRLLGFTNQALGDSEAPGFVIVRSKDLLTLTFENNNYRRLALGLQSPSPRSIGCNFTNATELRMLLTAERTSTQWNAPAAGAVTVIGGIRTDSVVSVPSGKLVLNRETSAASMEIIDPREAWVETYLK